MRRSQVCAAALLTLTAPTAMIVPTTSAVWMAFANAQTGLPVAPAETYASRHVIGPTLAMASGVVAPTLSRKAALVPTTATIARATHATFQVHARTPPMRTVSNVPMMGTSAPTTLAFKADAITLHVLQVLFAAAAHPRAFATDPTPAMVRGHAILCWHRETSCAVDRQVSAIYPSTVLVHRRTVRPRASIQMGRLAAMTETNVPRTSVSPAPASIPLSQLIRFVAIQRHRDRAT